MMTLMLISVKFFQHNWEHSWNIQWDSWQKAKEVNETIEEVKETDQDKNNVDKEALLLPRTDNRKHYSQQYREG